jgi:hypothetical protein
MYTTSTKKIESIAKTILSPYYLGGKYSKVIDHTSDIAAWEKLLIANRVEKILGYDVDEENLEKAKTLEEIIKSFRNFSNRKIQKSANTNCI